MKPTCDFLVIIFFAPVSRSSPVSHFCGIGAHHPDGPYPVGGDHEVCSDMYGSCLLLPKTSQYFKCLMATGAQVRGFFSILGVEHAERACSEAYP